jgi:hypothetical protein
MKTVASITTALFLAAIASTAYAAGFNHADLSVSKTFSQSSEGGEGGGEGSEKPKGEGGSD